MIAFDRLMIVYDWFKNIEKEKQTQDQTKVNGIRGTDQSSGLMTQKPSNLC